MDTIRQLKLMAGMALPPQTKGLCGKKGHRAILQRCISEGDCQKIKGLLKDYKTMGPYLRLLQTAFDMSLERAIEAYWIGVPELRDATKEHFTILLEYMQQWGAPPPILDAYRQAQDKTKTFFPHHTYQVLLAMHIRQNTENAEKLDIGGINHCAPAPGVVTKVQANGAITVTETLFDKNLNIKTRDLVVSPPKSLVATQTGSYVILHQGHICANITSEEYETLTKWNRTIGRSFQER